MHLLEFGREHQKMEKRKTGFIHCINTMCYVLETVGVPQKRHYHWAAQTSNTGSTCKRSPYKEEKRENKQTQIANESILRLNRFAHENWKTKQNACYPNCETF